MFMVNENQEDVGEEIIRFHRIITHSLEIVTQKVKKYLENGKIEDETRDGFLKYLQSFSIVVDAHHALENEKIFPYFENKLADAPYDRLVNQHKMFLKSLTEINGAVNNIKSNINEFDSLNSIKTSLRMIEKMWGPHMKIEEGNIYGRVGSLNLGPDENNKLKKEYFKFIMEHGEPLNLVIPFVLYNLSPEDRVVEEGLIPDETKKLIETDWKDEWVSMKPFMLE